MDPATNKAAFRRLIERFINHGDESVADRLVTHDVVSHSALPGQPAGIDGFKGSIAAMRRAFPDLHCEIRDLIAERDKVVGFFHVTGTHRGDFMGHPASGAAIEYEEMVIVRFESGRIVEHWAVADVLSMMLSIGAATMREPATQE